MLKVKVRLSARVAAASWVAPSRPISSTSVAWISLLGHIGEDQRPGKRQRRAQLVAPRAPALVGRNVAASIASSLRARSGEAIQSKRCWHARIGVRPLATRANRSSRPRHEIRARNLEAAGRDQGRAGPAAPDAVLRRRSTACFRRGRRRSRTACSTSTSTAAWSSSRRGAQWSDVASGGRLEQYRLRDLVAALDKARTTAGSRRSRSTSTASPAAARPRSATSPMQSGACARAGKPVIAYGVGYTDDSYAARLGGFGDLAQPAGRRADLRPGRIEPLLQGPARQARRHRQRLSRRHLQVGGRAVHPQRHVARSQSRITWRSTRRELETWQQAVKQARPKANIDLFLKNMNGAVAAAGGDMAKAALAGRARRPRSATGAGSRRGSRQLGGGAGDERRAFKRIKLASYVADVVDRKPERPDRGRDDRRHDRRRQGRARHRRRRHHRQARSRTASATRASRRWSCASTARAARCSPPSASARRCSKPRRSKSRSSCRWAASPPPAAIGSRRPADFIYAEPSTITGSIGVFGVLPSFQGTLQKLGVGADGVKTTPLSGEPDLLKGPSPEASQLIQTGVESMYARFLGIVAAVAAQDAAAGRPDRAGARVGRRHGAPARPGRRLRRDERGDRQGGAARRSSATSAAFAISSRRRPSATS